VRSSYQESNNDQPGKLFRDQQHQVQGRSAHYLPDAYFLRTLFDGILNQCQQAQAGNKDAQESEDWKYAAHAFLRVEQGIEILVWE
jgi:hypothetical protein